ncbi:MAG TPA: aspartate ammonia-lyase [Candidatus Syntrophoarchaeum butanivorans]|uniref:Aspartate ammonia-lyase n=1 Tax=Candidatus Syntropharchaeum butanivorans TaxID=1839936 RepID=A0A1F2P3W3_9EURY|nr:MAG: aspartate ammonia-lyase [Candidatus Syntrophoarchaeum butanivorans]HEC56560.1 aspartate ammonia-lyase [Candidatus Syntrophoarchaeum butanivorans]
MSTRIERDSLGEREVPADVYYGIHTLRSLENFSFSDKKFQSEFIESLAIIKLAAVRVNRKLGFIDEKRAGAIEKASLELIEGRFSDQFPLDIFQSGSGTSTNMNINEVIANRACEILGAKKGDRSVVHPNDHVNMGQSTNNVIPTAMRMTALRLMDDLIASLRRLSTSFKRKSEEFRGVIKSGRTHLQDAVPITLGQEFHAYQTALRKDLIRLEQAKENLREIGVGGNAVGTGINTHPDFRHEVVMEISRITGVEFKVPQDGIEITQFLTDIAHLSSILRLISLDINKIANDLRLLASGPKTGLYEIVIPPVEPGSSIMPGKVNPSILEAVNMACLAIQGNDYIIANAAQAGQLELNTHMPIVAYCIIDSIKLLSRIGVLMAEKCVDGIDVNEDRCREYFEKSIGLATVLNPYIGYDRAAEVAKEALREGRTIREIVLEKGILDEDELDSILDHERITSPNLEKVRKVNKML